MVSRYCSSPRDSSRFYILMKKIKQTWTLWSLRTWYCLSMRSTICPCCLLTLKTLTNCRNQYRNLGANWKSRWLVLPWRSERASRLRWVLKTERSSSIWSFQTSPFIWDRTNIPSLIQTDRSKGRNSSWFYPTNNHKLSQLCLISGSTCIGCWSGLTSPSTTISTKPTKASWRSRWRGGKTLWS